LTVIASEIRQICGYKSSFSAFCPCFFCIFWLSSFPDYSLVFYTADGITAEKLKKIVETSLSKGKGEAVMTTLAEKYIEEGFQKGIQQGMQQGIQQGILEGLLEGIELGIGLKFGAQGVNLMPAIRQIKDPDRLKAIKEAVKVAKTIDDIKELISG
jgi:hypothetical protein